MLVAESLVVRIPLRTTIRHAAAARASTEALVVRLVDGAQVGWGEGAPRTHVHGAGASAELLRLRTACRRLTATPYPPLGGPALIASWLDRQDLGPGGRCALELALLDLWARHQQRGLLELLGPPQRKAVVYSALLPLLPPPAEAAALRQIAAAGFADLKVKLCGERRDWCSVR